MWLPGILMKAILFGQQVFRRMLYSERFNIAHGNLHPLGNFVGVADHTDVSAVGCGGPRF